MSGRETCSKAGGGLCLVWEGDLLKRRWWAVPCLGGRLFHLGIL